MSAIDFPARPRPDPLIATDFDVEVDDDGLDELLARPAAAVAPFVDAPLAEALDTFSYYYESSSELALVDLLRALAEGTYWDPEKHPRWPPGTKNAKGEQIGGQFIRVGQRIRIKGVDYDVAATLPGRLHLNVASEGDPAKAKTVGIDAKLGSDGHYYVEGAEHPAVKRVFSPHKGHGASGTIMKGDSNITVVDPYVDSSTHDPKIPIPAGSPITPDEWKLFGKLDQEKYAQVQERYGKWSATAAQAHVNAAWKNFDSTTQQLVKTSYSTQINWSYSDTLSLLMAWSGINKGATSPSAQEKYERAKELQGEISSAIQWDLYNRTHAPDVATFHKADHSKSWWKQNILSKINPVFSGMSQSYSYRDTFWAKTCVATPVAIRHVNMALVSAQVASEMSGEREMAIADQMAYDDRSYVWESYGQELTPGQTKWMEGITNKACGGWVIDKLRRARELGEDLPIPPEPADITPWAPGGKTWTPPPAAAKDAVMGQSYAELGDNGLPVVKPANQLELVAGDFIEGLQGTRYVVIEDPSDKNLGLRYYKLTDGGSGPVKGGAFSGHKKWEGNEESYPFDGGGTNPMKKLTGHFDLPKPQEAEKYHWNHSAWSLGGPDSEKKIGLHGAGVKFNFDNTPYEILEPAQGGKWKCANLENGTFITVNGDFKTAPYVLKPGYSETGEAKLDPANYFMHTPVVIGDYLDELDQGSVFMVGQTIWQVKQKTPTGHLIAVQSSGADKNIGKDHTFDATQMIAPMTEKPFGWQEPKVGDTLAYEGKKGVVTKVLKSGDVQINLKPGMVKLKPSDPLLAGLFNADDYFLGDKLKLRDMAVGQKFHGGTGAKVRPYQVLDKDEAAKTVKVKNLDTGEETSLSQGKSYAPLNYKQTSAVAEPLVTDMSIVGKIGASFNPDEWQAGDVVQAGMLNVGAKFQFAGMSFEVQEIGVAKNLADGKEQIYEKGSTASVTLLVPKQAQQMELKQVQVGSLKPGDKFGLTVMHPEHWEVVKVNATTVEVKGVESGTKKAFGTIEHVWTGVPIAEPAPAPGAISDPAALKPGTLIQSHVKGEGVQVPAIWRVVSVDVAEGTVATEIVTAAKLDKGVGAGKVGDQTSMKFELIASNMSVVSAATPAAPTSFDPDAYKEVPVTDDITIGTITAGSIFKGKTGAYFQIDKHSASGKDTYARNLLTSKLTKLKSDIKPAAVLIPDWQEGIDHDKLSAGDWALIDDLKTGDQYKVHGETFQVVDDTQGSLTIAPVLASGSLGMPTPMTPGITVKFHQPEAAPAQVTPPEAAVMSSMLNPSDVEMMPVDAYDGYLHPKSGTKHYPQIGEMPVGTVFQDKSKAKYKVVASGPQPLVTDGEKVWNVNKAWRGFVLTGADASFADHAEKVLDPETSQASEIYAAAAEMKLTPNTLSLEQLAPKVGDWMSDNVTGAAMEIKKVENSGKLPLKVIGFNDDEGSRIYTFQYVPSSYWAKDSEPALFVTEKASNNPSDYTPTGAKLSITDAQPGQFFLAADGDGVLKVVAKTPTHTQVVDLSDNAVFLVPDSGVGGEPLNVLVPKDADLGGPTLAPAYGDLVMNASPNVTDGAMISQVKVGGYVGTKASGGTVWKVISHNANGTTTIAADSWASVTPEETGELDVTSGWKPLMIHLPSVIVSENKPVWSEFVKNDLGVEMSALSVGDLFASSTNENTGFVYKVTGANQSGMVGYEVVWPPMHAGSTNQTSPAFVPAYVNPQSPIEKKGGAAADVTNYTLGDKTLLGNLANGDFFKSATGTVFKVVDNKSDGIHVVNMKSGKETLAASAGMPVIPLLPKAVNTGSATSPTTAPQVVNDLGWEAGGGLQVGDLKAGDHFVSGGGIFKIVEPGNAVTDFNAKAEVIKAKTEGIGPNATATPAGTVSNWSPASLVDKVWIAPPAASDLKVGLAVGFVEDGVPQLGVLTSITGSVGHVTGDGTTSAVALSDLSVKPSYETSVGGLAKGQTFQMHQGGLNYYRLIEHQADTITYESLQSGDTGQMGTQAGVWVGDPPSDELLAIATASMKFAPNTLTIDNLPSGAQFVHLGSFYEIMPVESQSDEVADTWVKNLVTDSVVTFGETFVPGEVYIPPGIDPSIPNWAGPQDEEPDTPTSSNAGVQALYAQGYRSMGYTAAKTYLKPGDWFVLGHSDGAQNVHEGPYKVHSIEVGGMAAVNVHGDDASFSLSSPKLFFKPVDINNMASSGNLSPKDWAEAAGTPGPGQIYMGATEPGMVLHIPATSGTPEGDYEVMPGEPYKDWQPPESKPLAWKSAPEHIENPVYAKNLATGYVTWFNPKLAVDEPQAKERPPVALATLTVGTQVEGNVPAHYAQSKAVWEITKIEPNEITMKIVKAMVPIEPDDGSAKPVGEEAVFTGIKIQEPGWFVIKDAPEPDSSTWLFPNVADLEKWYPVGGFTVGELLPGETFKSMSGNYYGVLAQGEGPKGNTLLKVIAKGGTTSISPNAPATKMLPMSHVGGPPVKAVGQPAAMSDVAVGDFIKTGVGNVFRIEGVYPSVDGQIHFEMKLVSKSDQASTGALLTHTYSADYPIDAVSMWTWAAAVEPEPEPESASAIDNPLVPYLHPHSGKKKFAKLETLSIDTVFHDKAGKAYIVAPTSAAGAAPTDYVHFTDIATGKVYAAPGSLRVYVPPST